MSTAIIRPVMFRAGRRPGEADDLVSMATIEAAMAAPTVLLADVSEFQPDIADAAYLNWSKAIVIRAMYGDAHDDGAWYGGARRADLHAGGAQFLGIYQYLVASQDPVTQAQALCSLLGSLEDGEVVICDVEEGAGSQQARWMSWAQVVRSELGDEPWDYSGENFAASAGLAPVSWVAAYQASEPSVAHTLWQFTDAYAIPGVGTADCSLYHGPVSQLAALAHGGQPVPAPAWPASLTGTLATVAAGSSGDGVKSAQGLLCARGYTVTIDGSYGPVTQSAVTAFQHASGLTPDGITGPDTWAVLAGPLATVDFGTSGDDVKSAQGLLCARGYTVTIDGQYGTVTRSAVTAFQHAAGISADGITGPDTWTKLAG
jgi:Putative peptidoglycan binding domain/Glycosyl hydrolases family 25